MGTGNGSLILNSEIVEAKFLLLHGNGDQSSCELWRIVSKGPKVYSKENMLATGYVDPSSDHYLVIEIEKVDLSDFGNAAWNFKELTNYKRGRGSSIPYTCSLTELMNVKSNLINGY